MRKARRFVAGLAVAALCGTPSFADECSDVAAGAQHTPSPDWNNRTNPFPGMCYVDWPGGQSSSSKQRCDSVPGHVYFQGDSGSHKNTCIFRLADRPSNDDQVGDNSSAREHGLPGPTPIPKTEDAIFEKYPPSGVKYSNCQDDLVGSLYTTGPVEYYCRITELAHLQKPGEDQVRKFVATACGRGPDDRIARHNAATRAHEFIFGMEIEKAKELKGNPGRNEIFVTNNTDELCKKTADERLGAH
jgi:hypothetical protein